MIASGVIVTALAVLTTVITTGVAQSAVARQRQSADGLANQTIEQVRALPFATLQKGLSNTDTSGDPKITSTGCPTSPCFGGEMLVTSAGLPNLVPLVPHRSTLDIGPTPFTISTYVTYYHNDKTTNTYRVTTEVTWSSMPSSTARSTQVSTVVFSPATTGTRNYACLSTTPHPFAGPCQSSFTSSASAEHGTVSVTGSIGGITLDKLELTTGRSTSDLLVEQISRVDGLTEAPGATLSAAGLIDQTVGRETVTSKADNDPGSSAAQGYNALTLTGAANTRSAGGVTISATAGSAGKTTSTTSATTSGNACPNITSYTNENDTLACGGSSSTQGATVTAATNLSLLGAVDLARVNAQATPVVAITDQNKGAGTGTPGAGTCPTTPATGDGCTRAYMSRAGAGIDIGGLGAVGGIVPLGFDYFAKITGLSDVAKAEAGPGVNAPSASASTGTIQYWTGLGYTSASISSIVAPITIPDLSINTNVLLPGLGAQITLGGSIQPPAKSTSSTTVTNATDPSCPASVASCTTKATAKISGPTLNITYKIVALGVTVADLVFTVDTGTIQSKATYVASPAA